MPGDCTLTQNGAKYNFCVKAHRRTVFTNLDRVYTMKFLVSLLPACGTAVSASFCHLYMSLSCNALGLARPKMYRR